MSAAGASVTVVVTTFNRAGYLRVLLQTIARLDPAPSAVIVVNNASTDDTDEVIASANLPVPLIHHRLHKNVGGSGGFSVGAERALAEGAEWLWLMDDDVEALPGAIAAFQPWMGTYRCLHGRRYDHSGKPFFWQHHFNAFLGVHFPVRGNVFRHREVFLTNVGCFEGMLVHADVVRRVGLPDPRFFLNGDDTTYGWLIAQSEPVAYINGYVLKKARPQKQIDLGVRHLNDSNDLGRYCGMRNRGHLARYLRANGKFNRWGFGMGTLLTAAKELLRLVAVEHSLSGLASLWRGWRESRGILTDPGWQPMPPVDPDRIEQQKGRRSRCPG
ncbi:glycosyltransferase [Arthrobacter sp. H20]|uniref:glycosyltransferase n=1 Tax=Arthrobacter sp. H20 TaxID=1267981 RepID=UPI0004BCBFB4|nr:glycosyltransferase [Arthrobacter sp. H20]